MSAEEGKINPNVQESYEDDNSECNINSADLDQIAVSVLLSAIG